MYAVYACAPGSGSYASRSAAARPSAVSNVPSASSAARSPASTSRKKSPPNRLTRCATLRRSLEMIACERPELLQLDQPLLDGRYVRVRQQLVAHRREVRADLLHERLGS